MINSQYHIGVWGNWYDINHTISANMTILILKTTGPYRHWYRGFKPWLLACLAHAHTTPSQSIFTHFMLKRISNFLWMPLFLILSPCYPTYVNSFRQMRCPSLASTPSYSKVWKRRPSWGVKTTWNNDKKQICGEVEDPLMSSLILTSRITNDSVSIVILINQNKAHTWIATILADLHHHHMV